MEFTQDAKKMLLAIARQAIVAGASHKAFSPDKRDLLPEILQKAGAFVTLDENGQLRGCVGYIESRLPLYQTVQDAAIAAAMHDTRFKPVRPDDVVKLEIEISVLSPFYRIQSADEIEVGKHGLYLTSGYRTGLLLPQVATAYQWDVTTFLQQTCRKAGLPVDAWKSSKTVIEIFSAVIFNDNQLGQA